MLQNRMRPKQYSRHNTHLYRKLVYTEKGTGGDERQQDHQRVMVDPMLLIV